MPLLFYEDAYPVAMLTFSATVYYFKLKHFAVILKTKCANILSKLPPAHVVSFHVILNQYPNCQEKHHPTTKFVSLQGVRCLIEEFAITNYARECLDKFVRQNVDVPYYKRLSSDYTFEDTDQKYTLCKYDQADAQDDNCATQDDNCATQIKMGTLKYNIRFVLVTGLKKKWYYKVSDVFDQLQASCVYNLNKHVSDKNIIKWRDLKLYLEDKYRCCVDNSNFKSNSFFFKQAGLKQLLLARKQNALYNALCLSAINYDFEKPVEYVQGQTTCRRYKKLLYADQCEVGRKYNRLDYIKMPNNKVWYKLLQCLRYYRLKHVQLQDYKIERWANLLGDLQKHNIKWKGDTRMIEGAELYRMLHQYALPLEADQIYFNT
ncbi:hypothetical protein [Mocis latipes granulovirus]|uniref:Uncharacterized protein n=1 Tax=Mocis latipes granulovirus TaxID=2072024 RepID=A0A161C757_9BBAC|nr:hypothetical protein [Mocis latipes granulovirus]AKR17522.1 hypothetical protein [Mocis latipes granulovirus]